MTWRAALLLPILTLAACATRPFSLPPGPGLPAPEAAAAWAEASGACAGARTFRAELRLSGRIDGEPITSGGVNVAIDRAGSIGLEARAFGSQIFHLAGSSDRATLYLRRDDRVITARAEEIVEALIGVKLGPERLIALLSGCVTRTPTFESGVRFGSMIEVTTADGPVVIERRGGKWEPRAGRFDGLVAEYAQLAGGWPKALRIRSEPGRSPAISLSIEVNEFEVNQTIPPSAFVSSAPPTAVPATLEELRAAGPLRERK